MAFNTENYVGQLLREVTTRVVPATYMALEKFPVRDLREYAETLGVPKGRKKADTIINILQSGRATMLAQLGD